MLLVYWEDQLNDFDHVGDVTLGAVSPAGNSAMLNVTLSAGVHKITAVHSVDGKSSLPLFQIVHVHTNN